MDSSVCQTRGGSHWSLFSRRSPAGRRSWVSPREVSAGRRPATLRGCSSSTPQSGTHSPL